MNKKDIIDAWAWIRKNNQAIHDDVLDLMKDSAIEKLGHTEVKRGWKIIEERKIVSDGYWTGEKEIIKVLRKSDGVVFDENELVDSTWGKQIITGFEIRPDGDMVVCFETCRNPLEKISKLPERTKLFVSDDGKDIFEGDHFHAVDPEDFILIEYTFNVGDFYKRFKNLDSAKEYILMNKPLLSVNDILNLDKTDPNESVFFRVYSLKELAKKKTNPSTQQ